MEHFIGRQNTIIFDDIKLENQIRKFLKALFVTDECYNIFNTDITLVSMDSEVRSDSNFPCVTMEIINNGVDKASSDSMQMQNRTRFTTEIVVYTSGENRRLHNRQLSNIIIEKLQIFFGLQFMENEEVQSPDSNIVRRVLRATNIYDNVHNLIYNL